MAKRKYTINKLGYLTKEKDILEKYDYEIEAFELLKNLRTKYSKFDSKTCPKKTELIELLDYYEKEFNNLIKKNKIIPTVSAGQEVFLMNSSIPFYVIFLVFKILSIDKYRISGLLSFQNAIYRKNKYIEKDFISFIENKIYFLVKEFVCPEEELRLKEIMDWVDRHRFFMVSSEYYAKLVKSHDKVTIPSKFALKLAKNLKEYFPKYQHKSIDDLIINNREVTGLVFKGKAYQLIELFKRLHYNKKIYAKFTTDLSKWIYFHFSYLKKGEPQEFSLSYVESILKNPNKEKTGNLILENLAPYIPPEKR